MNSNTEDFLITEVHSALTQHSVGKALDLLQIFVDQIINDVRATSRVFSSKQCDDLCRAISISVGDRFTDNESPITSQYSTIFLLSEIIESGGHIELLKDYIALDLFAKPCVVVTNLFSRQNPEIVEKFRQENSIPVFVVEAGDSLGRLRETMALFQKISPQKLILLNHHQDSGAIVAALSQPVSQKKYFIHHADHQMCLGVTCNEFIHIDLHSMGYELCNHKLGIKNNKYWPLIVRKASLNNLPELSMREGGLLTCSSGNSRKFEANNYKYDYFELLPKILLATKGSHVHIGPLTAQQLERLQTSFEILDIDWGRFRHIPWVSSVSNELLKLGVNLYISSFPLGGGKTILEAMSIGIPLLMHENYRSRLNGGVDLAYPEALVWRDEAELLTTLGRLSPQLLKNHSQLALNHFEQFHSAKVLMDAVGDLGMQDIEKIPKLSEYHPDQLQIFLEDTAFMNSKVQHLSSEIERVNSEWANAIKVIVEIQEKIKMQDLKIHDLGQQVQTRDRQIEDLGQQVQTRDRQIEDLGQQVQTRDRQIEDLGQQVQTRDRQIEDLGLQVQTRDRQIEDLGLQVQTRDRQIEDLGLQLGLIYGSRSWKLTAPLRDLKNLLTSIGFAKFKAKTAFGKVQEDSQLQSCAPHADSDFDEAFYCALYPDILKNGLNPLQHFRLHGKAEGRLGRAPSLDLRGSLDDFNAELETVIVVSHEATLTGAPILAKNIVDELKKRYNVIVILMGVGPLTESFYQKGVVRVIACAARNNELLAERMFSELLQVRPIKFAIVNTIESASILPSLAKRGIPTLSLIHEFALSVNNKEGFRKSCFWPEQVVFSSKLTHENLIQELPELNEVPIKILAQGKSATQLSSETTLSTKSRQQLKAFLESQNEECFVVLGIGTIYYRKGVDLFIQCASHIEALIPEKKFIFLWIGKNVDEELGTDYFSYLSDQIKRNSLQNKVFFFDEMADIEFAYQSADILLLSSRLDPLPNVAIDALSYGVPVVCFDKASGIVDILKEEGLEEVCIAPFLDVKSMAEKVLNLIQSEPLLQKTKQQCQNLAKARFCMANYVAELERIAQVSALTQSQFLKDVLEIKNSGLFRFDYATASHWKGLSQDDIIAAYVRGWRTGIDLRKPMPGFHPGIYKEKHGVFNLNGDPFADFIREGCPPGPWSTQVLSITNEEIKNLPGDFKIALHIHVFYPRLLHQILNRIGVNKIRPDLFVSVPSHEAKLEVENILETYKGKIGAIEIVPNIGRDISPLLTLFGEVLINSYDIIGHIHTKVSPHVADEVGSAWSHFLFENILGGDSGPIADSILCTMYEQPELGLAFPDDPNPIGWDKNLNDAMYLADKLHLTESFEKNFNFPVGTMFWARKCMLEKLVQLGMTWSDYPAEPLPIDGTILHAIERMLPFIEPKMKNLLINVPNVSR